MTFEKLIQQKPTLEWRRRMEEGDDLFTDEAINAADVILDSYISRLKELEDRPAEAAIMENVKEVVSRFNELNDQHDYFIETMEREELAEFIQEGAKIAGLKTKEDITEEWREW
ncbi:hypothetical protein [Domibacillus indicus]|uniref:hypothetical protein n=1 Tax=Domibacillus indicus TaxID=1437523 RepID=UPI000617BDB2|nr:hypothetical protein [Domibacillus indicus]